MCAHMGTTICDGQKRASVLLELELQVVVRCVAWVVKTGLGLSVEENTVLKAKESLQPSGQLFFL